MADVKFEVVRFAASTAASGTQDVTISGFGTPKAVLFFASKATTDDSITSEAFIGVGATDGTRQWCAAVASDDGVTTTDSNLHQVDTGCCGLCNVTGTAMEFLFSFSAWITDGVRLTITTQAASAFLVTAVFIGGTDVSNAYVNFKDDLSNGTGTVNITDPGFTPDVVFAANVADTAINTGGQDSTLAFGACLNDGSQTQKSAIIYGQDNVTTTATTGYISNTYFSGKNTNAALAYGTSLTSFTASGFNVVSSAAPSRHLLYYLALKFTNSPDLALVDMTWPTSGNYAETGPGFQPDFGLICSLVGPTARDTIDASNGVGLSFATFDASNIYTTNYTDDDGQTITVAKSLSSDQLRILDSDGSTNAVVATLDGFDADGWDFTLSTNPASAVYGWAFAFGDGVGGGATEAAVSYGLTANNTLSATATALASIDADLSADLSSSAQADRNASVGADLSVGSTNSGDAQAEAASSLTTNFVMSDSGQADTYALVNAGFVFGYTVTATVVSGAAIQAAVTFAKTFNVTAEAQADLQAAIAAGTVFGKTATAEVNFGASITAGVQPGAQATADAQTEAAISVGTTLAAAIIAQAAVEAGITVASVSNVTFSATSLSGDVITPDGRTFTVTAEARAFTVSEEDRTFTVQ